MHFYPVRDFLRTIRRLPLLLPSEKSLLAYFEQSFAIALGNGMSVILRARSDNEKYHEIYNYTRV